MDAKRCEPTSAWDAFDRWRPPHTRLDKGPTGREGHHLACTDAQYGVYTGLDEEGEMGIGTQAPIGHQYITRCSGGVHLLHVGEIMGT